MMVLRLTQIWKRQTYWVLNQFFSTCWNSEVPPLTYRTEDHSISCPDEFLCSQEEVLHFLMKLDTTKATGPDNIPVRMLKETARAITPSLTKLFNMSMQQCSFPTFWKSANIVPIPKSSSLWKSTSKSSSLWSTPTGYRPILLLPSVWKTHLLTGIISPSWTLSHCW